MGFFVSNLFQLLLLEKRLTTLRRKMKCPHCLVDFHSKMVRTEIGPDADGGWAVESSMCPSCNRLVLKLVSYLMTAGVIHWNIPQTWRLIRPKASNRPVPPSVPEEFAEDFKEACLVLPDSPKASAALSRRCLQHLLREVAKVKHQDLAREIQEVLDSGKLPSYIADAIDGVRNIGNFAAHPLKSTATGEVMPVESGEAEWNLDVLESLFDFFFVHPDLMKKKRNALNAKLKEVGKPPMK